MDHSRANAAYQRVMPRDLFNEGKLLKCIGQLALLIHNGIRWPLKLRHRGRAFRIAQDPSHGGIFITNVTASLNGTPLTLYTTMNGRDTYPLVWEDEELGVEGKVFTDSGQLTSEFTSWLDSKCKTTRP